MQFIDIQQSIKLTGLSDSTVRRWLRSLSPTERQKYVSRQGKKVVISKSFLLLSLKAEVSVFSQEEKEVPSAAFSVLASKDKQIDRLQDLNDKLLQELKVKDQDLKVAWSKVLLLQDENKQLLSAGQQVERPASIAFALLLVCVFCAGAVVALTVLL